MLYFFLFTMQIKPESFDIPSNFADLSFNIESCKYWFFFVGNIHVFTVLFALIIIFLQ